MGPSFLELVAEASRTDDRLKRLLGIVDRPKATSLPTAVANSVQTTDVRREVEGGNVLIRRKSPACKQPRVAATGASRGAKISDDASGTQTYNLLSTPEVNQVREALKSSSLELKAVVKDPLPDAIQLAKTVVSGVASDKTPKMPVEQNHSGGDMDNGCRKHQKDAPRANLMGQNSTARTMEWDDSIEETPDLPNRINRACLSSPNPRLVPPLKKYERNDMNNLKQRRRNKKWSLLEEEKLRAGVESFGRGNWKVILNAYHDVFEDRTAVDLKDKWRNLTK